MAGTGHKRESARESPLQGQKGSFSNRPFPSHSSSVGEGGMNTVLCSECNWRFVNKHSRNGDQMPFALRLKVEHVVKQSQGDL